MRVLFFCTNFLKYFSFYEEFSEILTQMYIGLNENTLHSFSGFNQTRIFSKAFRKILKNRS